MIKIDSGRNFKNLTRLMVIDKTAEVGKVIRDIRFTISATRQSCSLIYAILSISKNKINTK